MDNVMNEVSKNHYSFHDSAALFPMMDTESFDALKRDISANGLLEPIWLFDNRIIDGRNRYNACIATGVTPEFRQWAGEGSLINFIVSLNLNRRHLTTSQRAAIAVDMVPLLADEAKKRQRHHGGTAPGKARESLPVDSQEVINGEAAHQAATIMCVGDSAVYQAKKISQEDPETFQEVRAGKITVNKAARKLKAITQKPADSGLQERMPEEVTIIEDAPQDIPTARECAASAIRCLGMIAENDPHKNEAFMEVNTYINSILKDIIKDSPSVNTAEAGQESQSPELAAIEAEVLELIKNGHKGHTSKIVELYGGDKLYANRMIRTYAAFEYGYGSRDNCVTEIGKTLANLENCVNVYKPAKKSGPIDGNALSRVSS